METLIPESPPQVVAGVTLKFPAKLWRIVNSCKTGAIAWGSNGESIKVERKTFDDQYLKTGLFFKTSHFQSFIRQLNIYGFRKQPRSQDQEHGAVFVYKHDSFRRGHPDILSDVVRNTAVRKTQRETAIREVEEKHGKLKDIDLESQTPINSTQKIVDSHPLLKCPAEPVMRNGVSVEPLQKTKSRITTVYLNPRVAMGDIQHMSPGKLHHQVAGLLTAITDDHDVSPLKRQRQSQAITVCRPFKDRDTGLIETSRPAYHHTSLPLKVHTTVSNQILFVPNPCNKPSASKIEQAHADSNEDTRNINLDQYSQDSGNSQISLMFGCPIDRDDDDDDYLGSEFKQTLLQTCEIEPMESGFGEHGDVDVFDTEILAIDNSISSMGEQGYLTPAYYDPETGTVTLVLPSLAPEY